MCPTRDTNLDKKDGDKVTDRGRVEVTTEFTVKESSERTDGKIFILLGNVG